MGAFYLSDSHPMVYFSIWEMHWLPHKFPTVWENAKKTMVCFFPLDSHFTVYFIICEIHGFPLQFPMAWENAMKSIELGVPRKLVPIFFLPYGYFSSIRFAFYGILCCRMGNAWFSPSKSALWDLWLFFDSIIFFCLLKNLLIP